MMVSGENLLSFDVIADGRGQLIALEGGQDIPFAIARIYYMYDVTSDRGFHAHRQLRQVAICLRGSCQFILDDGSKRWQHRLDKPTQGLYIGQMIWREMTNFSPDCVLIVLASDAYDEADYIRDYDSFKQLVRSSSV